MTPEHPIILCGFTSSGKTTIGKLLSEQLGLPFYDTDQMLIEHYKMTIPEIFAKGGESLFRDYEHEIAHQVCGLGPSVVSTGGGMLTFDRNGEILEKSGTIFYIDRPFEDCYRNLALHPERPLFKNIQKRKSRIPISRDAGYIRNMQSTISRIPRGRRTRLRRSVRFYSCLRTQKPATCFPLRFPL